jgi:hypothetical protein
MKLLRYGPAGQEKPGLLDRDGRIRDLSGAVRDIDGETLAPASLDRLRRLDPSTLPLVSGNPRLGPCVAGVSKIVAIGLNYRLHAQEAGAAIPSEPIFFMKATSSICGPNDDVIIPKNSRRPITRSSSASSSAALRVMSPRPMRASKSPAIASSTTFPRENFRSSVAGNGPRARVPTPFARPARGWSPPMKFPTPASWRSRPRSTASGVKTAIPET